MSLSLIWSIYIIPGQPEKPYLRTKQKPAQQNEYNRTVENTVIQSGEGNNGRRRTKWGWQWEERESGEIWGEM